MSKRKKPGTSLANPIVLERPDTRVEPDWKRKCENCGEVYHDAKVTRSLLQQANQAATKGVEYKLLTPEELKEFEAETETAGEKFGKVAVHPSSL